MQLQLYFCTSTIWETELPFWHTLQSTINGTFQSAINGTSPSTINYTIKIDVINGTIKNGTMGARIALLAHSAKYH